MWTPPLLLLYEFVWLQCQLLSLALLYCEIEVPFPDMLLLCIWVTCFCLWVQSQCPSLTDSCFSLFSGCSPCCISWNRETQAWPHISALPSLTVGHSSLISTLGLAVILMSLFWGGSSCAAPVLLRTEGLFPTLSCMSGFNSPSLDVLAGVLDLRFQPTV